MLYQANDSLKEKFNSLKPKLKYFIQSMYACSFAAQVCQLQLSSLLGESIRNSSRKDFKYCWYTQLISLLRNYE